MLLLGYVDPGLGLLIWQTVVAAIVGLFFYLKKTRDWLFSQIRKLFRRQQRTETLQEEIAKNQE